MPTIEPDYFSNRSSNPAPDKITATPPAKTINGRWIVLGVVILGVVLAVVGLKFRQPSPHQRKLQTQPSTAPATQSATTSPLNR